MKKPTIPMLPELLPQQRIFALPYFVERPQPFDSVVGYDVKPQGVRLRKGPSNPDYLGQLEWAWSPNHGRVYAFYLHKGRYYWMLWLYWYDDNSWECGKWNWMAAGYVPRAQATRKQAAIHLLIDYLRFEKADCEIEHHHWINETGELDSSEWRMIGLHVWPELASRPTVEG